MSKKLYIKKDNHLLTLLDEENIQDKLDEKLDIEDVPTKTSDLNNDSGFLTSHQDISGKENKANKTTTLSSSSTNTQYPSAKAVYDAIQAIPSPEFIEITSNKGTASASTMDKFYVEIANNKRDVYYTEESNGSYSWHKLDTDVLDDLSIDWDDIQNKPTIPTKTSQLANDSNFLTSHQDISGKLDKAQGSSNSSKNVVTDSNGNITIEAKPTIPTKTSQLTNDGDGTNVFVKNNDSRLTDKRNPINNSITENSDLNSFKTAGFYYCQGDIDVAPTVTNQPLTSNQKSFVMIVEQASSTRVIQILTYYYTENTYTRTNINGTWSTWNRVIHDGNFSEYVDTSLSTTSTKPLTNARTTTALNGKLALAGGTMTGNVNIPSEYQATSGATGNIPFAGHLDKSSQSITDALPTLKSLIGTIKTNDNKWWNILSIRHRNGSNDGNMNGVYLKSLLTGDGDLIWNKEYKDSSTNTGKWVGERTILDSGNTNTKTVTVNYTDGSTETINFVTK